MGILVTGGAGFIGANLVRSLRARMPGTPVVVLDKLTYAGHRASIDGVGGLVFVRGDVCDARLVAQVLAEHEVESVVHLAAESHVDRSILAPRAFVESNVLGTATLLECARNAGVRRFVHVSTDEVYGEIGPDDPPADESAPLRPRSPYAASKAAADHLVLAWVTTYGFPAILVRPSNNYGPFQVPEKLIPLMILRAERGESLPVYGDGGQVRDWLHVADCCAAILRVLEAGAEGGIYNVAGGEPRKNLEVVHAILQALGRPASLVRHVPDRPGHDRRYAMDDAKLRTELGWRPAIPFDDGLRITVDWYRRHPDWVEAAQTSELREFLSKNYENREKPGA